MIYCENIVNVTLFFFTLPRFRNHFFFPPFSAMPLPQLLQFFSPISAIALPQLVCQFFFFLFTLGTQCIPLTPGQQNWVEEFRYYFCQNSTKSMREKKKKVERKNVEFQQRGYWNSSAQFCCPGVRGVRGVPKVKRKKKKFDKLIVAMPLPK